MTITGWKLNRFHGDFSVALVQFFFFYHDRKCNLLHAIYYVHASSINCAINILLYIFNDTMHSSQGNRNVYLDLDLWLVEVSLIGCFNGIVSCSFQVTFDFSISLYLYGQFNRPDATSRLWRAIITFLWQGRILEVVFKPVQIGDSFSVSFFL